MKSAVTRKYMVYDSPCELLRVFKFKEKESRMVVARWFRGSEMGSYFLMGIELEICKVKRIV
jgi:hypothetical protein